MAPQPAMSDCHQRAERRSAQRTVDLAGIAAGLAATVLAGIVAAKPIRAWEVTLFRAINDLPHDYEWALWPIQQLGIALAIPVGGVVLWRLSRSWYPPVVLVSAAAVLGWGAANIARQMVGRSRPGSLLADVQLGYDVPVSGEVFPSGHAIVVVTLATVFAPYVSARVRWLMLAAVAAVALTRMYVGAHLPLDLIGGAALGLAIGSIVNVVAGIYPSPRAEMNPAQNG